MRILQSCVTEQRGYVLRNALLATCTVRNSWRALTETEMSEPTTHPGCRAEAIASRIQTIQLVTVLNTEGYSNTMVSVCVFISRYHV